MTSRSTLRLYPKTARLSKMWEHAWKYLLPYVSHSEVPMRGLGIGKQMKFLKLRIDHE